MKPDRLENMLGAYAAQRLPEQSGLSTAEVWHEIERRRRKSFWLRIFPVIDWRELFAEPRLAVAALAFAIMVGVVPAMAFSRLDNERRLARQSIHFDVFSADAGTLGSIFAKPVAILNRGKR